ncbi:hypothetical protein Hanom_Chr12g01115601 [Helianthus anomalus]
MYSFVLQALGDPLDRTTQIDPLDRTTRIDPLVRTTQIDPFISKWAKTTTPYKEAIPQTCEQKENIPDMPGA